MNDLTNKDTSSETFDFRRFLPSAKTLSRIPSLHPELSKAQSSVSSLPRCISNGLLEAARDPSDSSKLLETLDSDDFMLLVRVTLDFLSFDEIHDLLKLTSEAVLNQSCPPVSGALLVESIDVFQGYDKTYGTRFEEIAPSLSALYKNAASVDKESFLQQLLDHPNALSHLQCFFESLGNWKLEEMETVLENTVTMPASVLSYLVFLDGLSNEFDLTVPELNQAYSMFSDDSPKMITEVFSSADELRQCLSASRATPKRRL